MSPVATTAGSVASRPALELGGSALPPAAAAAVRTVVVDTDASGPDTCRVTFDDPSGTVLADSGVDLAGELVVRAGRVGDEAPEPLFDGLVWAVGFEHDDRGAFTVLTAYDRSYALFSGRRTTTYQDVTDSDVATSVAHDLGLQSDVRTSSVVHEHLSQVDETLFDFLTRRAREIDWTFRVTGRTLHFVPAAEADDAPEPGDFGSTDRLQLVPGRNLQRLSVRVSAAQQVPSVTVRGWDVATKEAITSSADAETRSASLPDTPASVAGRLGAVPLVVSSLPLAQQAEVEAVATATANRVGGSSAHVEGTAFGDPRLVAGALVSVGGAGPRFDGKAVVSRARHVWDDAGYRTTFVASGSHDRSLIGLLGGAASARPGSANVPGVVVGIVTGVNDPERMGRVKLRLPWLDDEYESGWARVTHPGAGKDRGFVALPEVDDEVLVAFEHGDTRRPYVLGGLFNGQDVPVSEAQPDQDVVVRRVWKSQTGHVIELDDTSGSEQVVVRTAGGRSVLTLTESGDVTVAAEGEVTVTSTKALKLTSDADVSIEAGGDATVSASGSLTLKASGDVTVSGAVIKLN